MMIVVMVMMMVRREESQEGGECGAVKESSGVLHVLDHR